MLKAFTIIYERGEQVGSHYCHITAMQRVITNDIQRCIKENYGGSIYFVLEGHPYQLGEFELNEDYKPNIKTFAYK